MAEARVVGGKSLGDDVQAAIHESFSNLKTKHEFLSLLESDRVQTLRNIPISQTPTVTVEQAEKDFQRERVTLNDIAFIPDKTDTFWSRAFSLALRELVERLKRLQGVVDVAELSTEAEYITDTIMQRGCRTSAGSDSFFMAQSIINIEGCIMTQKTSDLYESPIIVDVFLASSDDSGDAADSAGNHHIHKTQQHQQHQSGNRRGSSGDSRAESPAPGSGAFADQHDHQHQHAKHGGNLFDHVREQSLATHTPNANYSRSSIPALCARVVVKNSFSVYDLSSMDGDNSTPASGSSSVSASNRGTGAGTGTEAVNRDDGEPKPWLEIECTLVDESDFSTGAHSRRLQLNLCLPGANANAATQQPPSTAAGTAMAATTSAFASASASVTASSSSSSSSTSNSKSSEKLCHQKQAAGAAVRKNDGCITGTAAKDNDKDNEASAVDDHKKGDDDEKGDADPYQEQGPNRDPYSSLFNYWDAANFSLIEDKASASGNLDPNKSSVKGPLSAVSAKIGSMLSSLFSSPDAAGAEARAGASAGPAATPPLRKLSQQEQSQTPCTPIHNITNASNYSTVTSDAKPAVAATSRPLGNSAESKACAPDARRHRSNSSGNSSIGSSSSGAKVNDMHVPLGRANNGYGVQGGGRVHFGEGDGAGAVVGLRRALERDMDEEHDYDELTGEPQPTSREEIKHHQEEIADTKKEKDRERDRDKDRDRDRDDDKGTVDVHVDRHPLPACSSVSSTHTYTLANTNTHPHTHTHTLASGGSMTSLIPVAISQFSPFSSNSQAVGPTSSQSYPTASL